MVRASSYLLNGWVGMEGRKTMGLLGLEKNVFIYLSVLPLCRLVSFCVFLCNISAGLVQVGKACYTKLKYYTPYPLIELTKKEGLPPQITITVATLYL
jgi:hypothetical protein